MLNTFDHRIKGIFPWVHVQWWRRGDHEKIFEENVWSLSERWVEIKVRFERMCGVVDDGAKILEENVMSWEKGGWKIRWGLKECIDYWVSVGSDDNSGGREKYLKRMCGVKRKVGGNKMGLRECVELAYYMCGVSILSAHCFCQQAKCWVGKIYQLNPVGQTTPRINKHLPQRPKPHESKMYF